jgi:hypothetical protein
MHKPVTPIFGVYRPSGQIGMLAETMRNMEWRNKNELLQTVATKHPRERLSALRKHGETPYKPCQTHLWRIEENADRSQVRMTDLRPR